MAERGVVAAGHPLTARAGAELLRAGGNAVDAAVAAMLTSFVAEPMLTGLGAGGYLLVAPPGGEPVLVDFFVESPGRGVDPSGRAPLLPVEVSFGDAVQVFHAGAASCAVYGAPAGVAEAAKRFGTAPLAELTAPASALARRGVRVNEQQAYVFSLLTGIIGSTSQARARYLVDGRPPREGDLLADPDLADALDRLGAEGAAPFYTGDIGTAVADWVRGQGGTLSREDLAAYQVMPREPVQVSYGGRQVYTNPPPSAGGLLVAEALALLAGTAASRGGGPPDEVALAGALLAAQPSRPPTPPPTDAEAAAELAAPARRANRLGSTTHISVIDADGWACSVTCSNGEGSGLVVPGTGVHVNNMMGEEDLSPRGLLTHPPGLRLPSMMNPTVVARDGAAELVLGSAGSSRIRSALVQVIVNVIDRDMQAQEAVDAPRLHAQDGLVYVEPGIDVTALRAAGHPVTRFRAPNLFFGGCQAVQRHRTGALTGAGDPRRGGAVAVA
ncbi:MAG TPA: gamma-glutamyltransferase [Mycobacteriales bacterium]|nr:gamma-glutamyltransferase [Mycobacteriales bacterium]